MTIGLPEAITREFGRVVEKTAFENVQLLNIAMQHGCYKKTEVEWKSDYTEYVHDVPNPGFISWVGDENSPLISSGASPKNAILLGLFGHMKLSSAEIATFQGNALGINYNASEIIGNQMHGQVKAMEGMIACGQAGRYLDSADPNKRLTTDGDYIAKGLFFDSNIQTIGGGIDADNNMTAFGDYYATMNTIYKTIKDGGGDPSRVYVFMDSTTFQYMMNSLSTNIWESVQIKNGFISFSDNAGLVKKDWVFLSNNHLLANGLTANSYIWFWAPKDAIGNPSAKIVFSVPHRAKPLYGGNETEQGYIWQVGAKFGVVVKNAYCIGKTGALTLT